VNGQIFWKVFSVFSPNEEKWFLRFFSLSVKVRAAFLRWDWSSFFSHSYVHTKNWDCDDDIWAWPRKGVNVRALPLKASIQRLMTAAPVSLSKISFGRVKSRGARWFIFIPKIPIWVNFGGP
jgi:hypothetical protein